jgi:hypothetical protein
LQIIAEEGCKRFPVHVFTKPSGLEWLNSYAFFFIEYPDYNEIERRNIIILRRENDFSSNVFREGILLLDRLKACLAG